MFLGDRRLSAASAAELIVTLGALGTQPVLGVLREVEQPADGPPTADPAAGPVVLLPAAELFAAPELGDEDYGAILKLPETPAQPAAESTSAIE